MSTSDLGKRLLLLHTLRRKYMHTLCGECPLVPGQYPLLRYLMLHPDASQRELADGLFVSPASVALSSKRLEKAGFLEKRVNPENQRCKHLHVTGHGYAAEKAFREIFERVDEQTFKGFSDEEKKLLSDMLERMARNLSEGEEPDILWFREEKDDQ
ncbi:MAG TPA: MarR family transcriptional regulator [Eubacteriales bacterium]|nr:MarR family transcriptional regulator [Eubacteriales bacterium]